MTKKQANRFLITGGAGFIGSHLADTLLDQGRYVTIIDNLSTGSASNLAHLIDQQRFTAVFDDITNEVVMDRLVSECDVILHLAAAVGVKLIVEDPVHVIETNILGTRAVLALAKRYGRKVLLASTSEIYGKNDSPPFAELDDTVIGPTTRPRWSYAASKAIDEFLALAYHKQYGTPIVIFRLFNTIGLRQSGQYGMVVPRFVQQVVSDSPITVFGDGLQTRTFCDVRDVVRAIVRLAEEDAAIGEIFNIGSTSEITILDLARLTLELCAARKTHGQKPPDTDDQIRFVPYEDVYGTDFEDMRRRAPDISKIRALIGWKPKIPLCETLTFMINHAPGEESTDSGDR